MKLLEDWKRVVRRAWSFRLMLLAAALSGAEIALPLIGERFPQGVLAGLSFVVTAAALIARLMVQVPHDTNE
jgi:Kef-type K+ transport system membrane component KefB